MGGAQIKKEGGDFILKIAYRRTYYYPSSDKIIALTICLPPGGRVAFQQPAYQ